MNHLQQKADSLSRDLKKYMKDSAVSLAEFERALVRKTEECDVRRELYKYISMYIIYYDLYNWIDYTYKDITYKYFYYLY